MVALDSRRRLHPLNLRLGPRAFALAGALCLAGGCVSKPPAPFGTRMPPGRVIVPPPRAEAIDQPITPARVDIRCDRDPNGAVRMTLVNRTQRPQTVELRGLAY